MTAFTDRAAPHAATTAAKTPPVWAITTATVLFAAALTLTMFWPRLLAVWWHGAFYDSDDAMRLVQVRALLEGQAWFDMTAFTLDPPAGSVMHWSRVVDVPLAILIRLFGLFAPRDTAEVLARLVFPTALLLALFAGVARLADTLLGPVARVPAIGTAVLCGCAIVQFQPGRIDHHAPQIVTLVFMVGAALAALDPARARQAALAGALAALSLAISLENLPFIACLAGMLVAIWVWHGRRHAAMLRAFALGLAGGLVPFFLATVGPDRWFSPVCDAFGAAHLGAGLIGAAGCAGLTLASDRLRHRLPRLAGAGAVAALVVVYVALAYPACLHDPFIGVDPLVRALWISNVTESLPFPRFYRQHPSAALLSLMPVVLGLCGCIGAAVVLRGTRALRFVLLSALTATGLAMAFWQIRVFTSVTPLAICGALPLAVMLHDRLRRAGRDLTAVLALCLVFPFTSMAWAFALPDDPPEPRRGSTCLAPQSFGPLAALPAGRVVAPIDAGSFLLAHTGMSVFAAPYHRNNDGNRFALETFLAPPETAVAGLAARGALYVMICPGLGETDLLAKRSAGGLAAALLAGRVPTGLAPVAVAETPYQVFQILPTKN